MDEELDVQPGNGTAAALADAPRLAANWYAAARWLSDADAAGAAANADDCALQDERTEKVPSRGEGSDDADTASTITSLKNGHDRLETWRIDRLAAEMGTRRSSSDAAFARI